MQLDGFESIIRFVPGIGYLPIITVNDEEVYRGEYRRTFAEALYSLESAKERLGLS